MKDKKKNLMEEEVIKFSLQPSTFNLILERLPHRYPFLMVDKIVELIPGQKGRGIKLITINEDHSQGYSPQNHRWPQVFFVEALAQLSAVVAADDKGPASGRGLLVQAKNFVVERTPQPGDLIQLEVERVTGFGSLHQFAVKAVIAGETAARGELVFTLTAAKRQ